MKPHVVVHQTVHVHVGKIKGEKVKKRVIKPRSNIPSNKTNNTIQQLRVGLKRGPSVKFIHEAIGGTK